MDKENVLTEMQLNIQEQITPSNALTNYNNNTKLPLTLPADGSPRVVIASACSGSSAIMNFTTRILQAHGYDVLLGGEPQRNKNIINVAKKRLEARMNHEPTMGQILAEGLVEATETATANQQIYLFKIKEVNGEVLKTLKKLEAKFAFTYRGNLLDRAICMSRDCFGEGRLGHQVYENGTQSDACFDRRKHSAENYMAGFNDTESLLTEMEIWKKKNRNAIRNNKILYDPAEIAAYEDLFKFEYTDNKQVFDDSVKKWSVFLKNFADIQHLILKEFLLQYKNSRPPPAPLKQIVYNFDKLETILNESHFREFLSH